MAAINGNHGRSYSHSLKVGSLKFDNRTLKWIPQTKELNGKHTYSLFTQNLHTLFLHHIYIHPFCTNIPYALFAQMLHMPFLHKHYIHPSCTKISNTAEYCKFCFASPEHQLFFTIYIRTSCTKTNMSHICPSCTKTMKDFVLFKAWMPLLRSFMFNKTTKLINS